MERRLDSVGKCQLSKIKIPQEKKKKKWNMNVHSNEQKRIAMKFFFQL